MDIEMLLALQDFRNGPGAFLAGFLSKMTWLGELNTVLAIMALIYWCISKDFGTYFLMGWSGNRLVNGMMKVTVCAYRPWIRDARIVPYGDSITTATGYSFPSGHTMNAATVFGGGTVRRDLSRTLRVVLGLLVLLVAFSRIYLGVHTPQDVLVGAAAGVLVMAMTVKLMQWVGSHPEKDLLVLCIGVVLAAALAVYAAVKPYPIDRDAAGKVLVEGAKMANDTFKGVGWCVAFLTGWILERRFVHFSTDVSMMRRVTRLAVGLLLYYLVSLILVPAVKGWVSGPLGTFVSCYLQMFYVSFLFPWLFTHFENRGTESVGEDALEDAAGSAVVE